MIKGGMCVGKGGGVIGNRFGIRAGTHIDGWREIFYKQRGG